MKYYFHYLLLIILFMASILAHGQKKDSLKNVLFTDSIKDNLMGIINQKSLSEYKFSITPASPINDSMNVFIHYVSIHGSSKLLDFSERNRVMVIPILIELLNDEKYDWIANLLLYHLTNAPAIELNPFTPNKIDYWRQREKKNDSIFWENYFKKLKEKEK